MAKLFLKLNAITILLFTLAFVSFQNTPGKGGKVSVDEFEKLLSSTKNTQLIDVRTSEEFQIGHLKNALNIDINSGDFEQKIKALDKTKPVFVYCLSGGRSSSAAGFMRQNGFNLVYEMPGTMAWRNAGKPLESGDASHEKKEMTVDDYNKMVTSDKFVLVDFSAVWCQPCKRLSPILEKLKDEKKDKLILLKIDADENAVLMKRKHIDEIPYLELYKDGKLIWKHQGFIDEQNILSEIK